MNESDDSDVFFSMKNYCAFRILFLSRLIAVKSWNPIQTDFEYCNYLFMTIRATAIVKLIW